jgi:hypothetical protein
MRDVEIKVAELDLLFSSQRSDQLIVSESVTVGETRAVYQNGVLQFSNTIQDPRDRSEATGRKPAPSQLEVDLPALQWVEGLHSYILKQSQVEAKGMVGAEPEVVRGPGAREMRDTLAVLTAWRAELQVGVEA